tara:strand:- start:3989 stop:4963 length:975 start_codon:yes stop_codon:yes gene_type:complete
MKRELKKIELNLAFKSKRNFKIITPCCLKSNKDGKFVNYKGLNESFGYCHSCGKSTSPPTQYIDDNGRKYEWDDLINEFIPSVLQSSYKSVGQLTDNSVLQCKTHEKNIDIELKYIENRLVERYMRIQQQNNFLSYIGKTYGEKNKEIVKDLYKLGTSKDGGIIFWSINKFQKVQKAKVCYYDTNGKRTQKFKVPYKNEDGYYSCLFGEHLLGIPEYKNKPIILVESEKTAIISAINFPKYNWLSYGGINGMTNQKMKVLSGKNILIVPDLSENARNITEKKIKELKKLDIKANMWDLSKGMNDTQLKEKGYYNYDLEDFLREM